jgi:hypothetical protein
MQNLYEVLEATHASIVAHKGTQSWVLFTGPKAEASKAIDAIGGLLNLIGAGHLVQPFKIVTYYHPEVK